MPVNVTCTFTVDNKAHHVYYNNRPVDTVSGVRGNWREKKTFWFVESTRAGRGEIKFDCEDWYESNHPTIQPSCEWAGLLLHCIAVDLESGELVPSSPWHNFVSNTEDWHSEEGRDLCTNSGGMIMYNMPVVNNLLDKGAKKIWAGEHKLATLIGQPKPSDGHGGSGGNGVVGCGVGGAQFL